VNRGDALESHWGNYRTSQKIFNLVDSCWDLCKAFDGGTAREDDGYDSNDSDFDTYRPKKTAQVSSDCTPMLVDSNPPQISSDLAMLVDSSDPKPESVSTPAQVASDCRPMLVDSRHMAPPLAMPAQIASDPLPTVVDSRHMAPPLAMPAQIASDPLPTVVDLTPLPVSSPVQVTLDPMVVDSTPLPVSSPAQVATHHDDLQHPNFQSASEVDFDSDEDSDGLYGVSRQDVINAYSFVLELGEVPFTTIDDLLYYHYGFSLSESPYTGIPSSAKDKTRLFRSWTEVCRAVGGQQLKSSAKAVDHAAIQDFLSILAGCSDPFEEVPGKYWDLSPSGKMPIVNLSNVFISIEKMEFTDRKHYIIRPPSLHPSRDVSWFLLVDSMTALECIRRGLGPHTIDIANFLISHGVRFRTLQ
jgi:hypothetical protein